MTRRSLPPLDAEDRALWDALKQEVRPLEANRPDQSHMASVKPGQLAKAARSATSAARISKQHALKISNDLAPDLIWQAPGQFAKALNSTPMRSVMDTRAVGRARPNDLRNGGSQGLDRAKAERLRKGKMSIEGKLDLHGLTQDQAHGRLEAFVSAATKAGKRHLLIITGKGLSNGGQGVLRTCVPQWLGQGDMGRCVLAFSYAQKRDGEQGALYVLLRRQRG